MPGFVYCLSNPSLPGLFKVGRTDVTVEERASELWTTGVPTPFVIELTAAVEDSVKAEKRVHSLLKKYRENKRREFFRTSIHTVQWAFDHLDEGSENDHCSMCSAVDEKGKVYALYGKIGTWYACDDTYISCPNCQD